MAATRHQEAAILRRQHRRAQIDAGDGAARPLADARFIERNHNRRPPGLFLDAPGDDTDDAGVPASARDHRDSAIALTLKQRFRLLLHRRFDGAPFLIILVELRRDPRGFGRVLRRQQPHAQIRLPNRRPIHVLPIAWSVDGARGVHDPRSMRGGSLGLDLLVVSMAENVFTTLSHCLELAHLDLQGVAAAPVVSSLAALEEDEMDLGAVCIDMGGGSTSAAVWGGRSLLHIESLNVGGDHVTSDIARGLSTSKAGAERLKTLHGSAMASANEDREMLEAPPRGEDASAGPVIVPRAMLKTVIAPRVEETLELLRDRLKAAGVGLEPGAGLVLTGGASQLNGVRELAVRVFDRPVRLGKPQRAPHLADAASGPAFCATAGVLLRAAYGPREAVSARKLMARQITAADAPRIHRGNVVGRVAGWLRDNL